MLLFACINLTECDTVYPISEIDSHLRQLDKYYYPY